jgi:hypothetical protein|tara:strand:- start:1717 stop:1824 length:108 start_codon:yes stop_codon:yes gene_type:complete
MIRGIIITVVTKIISSNINNNIKERRLAVGRRRAG